jgi:hypothetical protein
MNKKERRRLGRIKANGVLNEQARWHDTTVGELDPVLVGRYTNTRVICSCECCGRKVNMGCYMDWKFRDIRQFAEMDSQEKEYFEDI